MERSNSDFRVNLNRDKIMNFVVNRLGGEAICWALFLHILLLVYVGCTGNLTELSVPPEKIVDMGENLDAAIAQLEDAGRNVEEAIIRLENTGRDVEEAIIRLENTGRDVEEAIAQLKDTGRNVEEAIIRLENTGGDLEVAIIRLESTGRGLDAAIAQLKDTGRDVEEAIIRLENTEEDLKNIIAQIVDIEGKLGLQKITPLKDPIFYTGIVLIIIVGYVWLRLSSDLPEALHDLKKLIKKENAKKDGEKGGKYVITIFRKPFIFANNLYSNKVLLPAVKKMTEKTKGYKYFLARFDCGLNTRLSYVFGVCGVLLYIIYQYKKAPIYESMTLVWMDWRVFPVNALLYGIIWTLCYFIIGIMVWKLLQIAIYIKKLFYEFETNINPFHPDKIGGLKPITNIVVNINLFVFSGGISLFIIYNSYLKGLIHHIWVIFAAYIMVSIFLFFYPLLGARKSMKMNKEKYMKLFSEQLLHKYDLVYNSISKDDDKDLDEKHVTAVENLKKFYDQAAAMPVWPFDRDTILTFASRVLLPIILVMVNMIIAKYIGK